MELKSKIERDKLNIFKFFWDEILPHKIKNFHPKYWYNTKGIRKKLDDNAEGYIHWLLPVLKSYVPKLSKGKQWSALCLYMNQNNIDYLHTQLEGGIWLNIAPTCCQELADDEYGIDPENVVVDLSRPLV